MGSDQRLLDSSMKAGIMDLDETASNNGRSSAVLGEYPA
jgi:hypothetical protein